MLPVGRGVREAAPVQWLTDFADQAIILPVGLAVVVLLLASRCWRSAAGWRRC